MIRNLLQIEQEITEKTEDRSDLCSLRFLLFKSPSVARSCRTPRLSDPAPRAVAMEPRRNRGVRCRVGAGVAPDAPHRPVREVFPHTVRQHPP
jgi:hypothetical protein